MTDDTQLGPETEAAISDLLGKGLFASRVDVLREGVRLLHQRETRYAAFVAAMAAGREAVGKGASTPEEDAAARLRAMRRPPRRDED